MTSKSSPAKEESSAILLQREMQDILKKEIGLVEEFAAMLAAAIVRGWRKRAGGCRIYIPGILDFASRNAEIKRRFNGTNQDELCREFGISRRRLYQIATSKEKNANE